MPEYKKYHRKYPDVGWNYRAVSTKVDGKELIFSKVNDKGKHVERVEVYSGKNYDPSSSKPSYSRSYPASRVPDKYKPVVKELQKEHRKTKWSKAKRVDVN